MPRVRRLTTFPVKSLDGTDRERAELLPNGGLAGDREFALFDADGDYVNGKRERAIHRVRSGFDPDTGTLSLDAPGVESATFELTDGERDALSEWFERYLGYPVELRRDQVGGFPDDTTLSGPTVVSTATVREVASWYEDVDTDEMRRRLRANVEIGADESAGEESLPPFWEDRLYAGRGESVAFTVDGIEFRGVNPCQRCVVPTRDPDTGAETPGFRERFVERRRETLPEWAETERFDHFFRLMVNTVVPEESVGASIAVGDPVEVGGVEPR
ncbi:MOSC domain-containing protein [Salinirubrum litoreum]|uniref:MOSC domain-containing protein n=1 Tax=Salinirubrum litoreum TaxID=1126234 RepID=A0ABD5R910_9EURY|nr:MOSC N-terminal beta barrel domain-containing protein [Salinirubrum litoreum]